MHYFLRISSRNRPANQLDQRILIHFEEYQHAITSNPAHIVTRIETAVQLYNRQHRRCKPQTVHHQKNRDTKAVSSIYVGGLVQLAVYPVTKTMFLDPELPKPTSAPEPPEAEPYTDRAPRAAIYASREGSQLVRYEHWHRFSDPVREFLRAGSVWRIYQTDDQTPTAELYGGRTLPAFL